SYLDAVRNCGAEPIVLPIGANLHALELCDGLLFAGGEDLAAPDWWRDSGPEGPTDQLRDTFETAVALRSREVALPTLALCRGAQLMNCSLGGGLTRRLPLSGC